MRVLIIEDNRSKLDAIRKFLIETYHDIDIHDALSYTAGLRRLYDEAWDYLLLDMSLPVYDMSLQDSGGDKKPVAGKEIMRRMIRRSIIVPTIIITQFDTFGENGVTIEKLNEEFALHMRAVWKGTVNYGKTSWMKDLKEILDNTMGEKQHDKTTDR